VTFSVQEAVLIVQPSVGGLFLLETASAGVLLLQYGSAIGLCDVLTAWLSIDVEKMGNL